MAESASFGGVCFESPAAAAAAWCGSHSVLTSSGASVSCAGVSGVAGPGAVFSWTRRSVDGAGLVTEVVVPGQSLPACEFYDWAYWAPYAAAFFGALLVIYLGQELLGLFSTDRDIQ